MNIKCTAALQFSLHMYAHKALLLCNQEAKVEQTVPTICIAFAAANEVSLICRSAVLSSQKLGHPNAWQ